MMKRRHALNATFYLATLAFAHGVATASEMRKGGESEGKETEKPAAVQQPYGYIAPVALSSPNLAAGDAWLFQPWFDAGNFAGDLRAYTINSAGTLAGNSSWRALDVMNRLAAANPNFWDNARVLITSDGQGRGMPFRFSQLTSTQQALVGSEDVVNYVRGNRSITLPAPPDCGQERDDDKEEGSSDEGSHNDDGGDKSTNDVKKSSNKTRTVPGTPQRGSSPFMRVATTGRAGLDGSYGFIKMSSLTQLASNDDGSDEGGSDEGGSTPQNCDPVTHILKRPLIGAIVHSRPVYVGPPRDGFPFDSYLSDFAGPMAGRKPVVYVGANDGILHAFDASSGAEIFGYVPSAVHGRLPSYASLTLPGGSNDDMMTSDRGSITKPSGFMRVSSNESNDGGEHCGECEKREQPTVPPAPSKLIYTVDGFITAQDVRINGQWKTILVGGLGAGGQGLYALDITNAGSAATSETAAGALVLWEFNDSKDVDLGYTYSRPSVIRMHDAADTWAVVVGNGYFSETADGRAGTGDAALMVINAATGQLIKKIVVDSRVTNQPNGLSSPTVIDEDNDYRADYVYAGDLHGNVWKFDIRSANPEQWRIANNGAALYTAKDESGKSRAITAPPAVGFHPISGFLVTVGTGRVLTAADVSTTQSQAVYGLWDDPNRTQAITRLASAAFHAQAKGKRTMANVELDWRSVQGWRVDLPETGERVLTEPIVRAGRVQFASTQPEGGTNFFNEIDIATGNAPPRPFWDLSKDGLLDDSDMVGGEVVVSLDQGVGLVSRPTFGMAAPSRDIYYINRLVTATKECVEKQPKRDDGEGDEGRSSRDGVSRRYALAASRSPFIKVGQQKTDDNSEEDRDDGDDDHSAPPEECEAETDQGDGDDGDGKDGRDTKDDRGGTCGKDFKPEPPPVVNETTSIGTVNQGAQEGRNASGRQMWREVVRPER